MRNTDGEHNQNPVRRPSFSVNSFHAGLSVLSTLVWPHHSVLPFYDVTLYALGICRDISDRNATYLLAQLFYLMI